MKRRTLKANIGAQATGTGLIAAALAAACAGTDTLVEAEFDAASEAATSTKPAGKLVLDTTATTLSVSGGKLQLNGKDIALGTLINTNDAAAALVTDVSKLVLAEKVINTAQNVTLDVSAGALPTLVLDLKGGTNALADRLTFKTSSGADTVSVDAKGTFSVSCGSGKTQSKTSASFLSTGNVLVTFNLQEGDDSWDSSKVKAVPTGTGAGLLPNNGTGTTPNLIVSGGGGADKFTGGLMNEKFSGDADADTFFDSGVGVDVLEGGAGSDTFKPIVVGSTTVAVALNADNADSIAGGTDVDTLDLTGWKLPVGTKLGSDAIERVDITATGLTPALAIVVAGDSKVNVATITGLETFKAPEVKVSFRGSGLVAETFVQPKGNFDDDLDGGSGTVVDLVSYEAHTLAVTVDLGSPEAGQGAAGESDIIRNFKAVIGTAKNDTLTAGVSGSRLFGLAGDDTLTGGDAQDVLEGGLGKDTLSGGAAEDDLKGGDGDDTIDGGAGDDTISGGAGKDLVTAGAGVDTVLGDAGNDTLDGGDEADLLVGGLGNDTIAGGAGNDSIDGDDAAASTKGGNDIIDAGDGDDTVLGRAGNDTIAGGAGADTLFGDAGKDKITGGDGNDTEDGGADDDTVSGGAGDDSLSGGAGKDTLQGEDGSDLIVGGDGADKLEGGVGADVLSGDAGTDNLDGGDDDDYADGGADTDTVKGGAGNDNLIGGAGKDTLDGGEGNDALMGGADIDTLVGGAGDDELWGGDGDDVLNGGTVGGTDADAGNDFLSGGAGADKLTARTGTLADCGSTTGDKSTKAPTCAENADLALHDQSERENTHKRAREFWTPEVPE
jgi:Ca2+-binding RTX toxin-like protein